MARTDVQCPHCGGRVEVFVDGRVTGVEADLGSDSDSAAASFLEGFNRGLNGADYQAEECPYCDGAFHVAVE